MNNTVKMDDYRDRGSRESGVRPRALRTTSAMVEANERLVEALVLAAQAQEAAKTASVAH